MDFDTKEGLRLLDHLTSCRCCFKKFDHYEEQVVISDLIEEQFLELTQIEVRTKNILNNK